MPNALVVRTDQKVTFDKRNEAKNHEAHECIRGNYEAARFLIDHGIDTTIRNYRWTATAEGEYLIGCLRTSGYIPKILETNRDSCSSYFMISRLPLPVSSRHRQSETVSDAPTAQTSVHLQRIGFSSGPHSEVVIGFVPRPMRIPHSCPVAAIM
jgi:hypothetical protein